MDDTNIMGHYLKSIYLTILKIVIGVLVYLGIHLHVFSILLFLAACDLMTGIVKARTIGMESSISSSICNGIKKKSLYFFAIVILAIGIKAIVVSGFQIGINGNTIILGALLSLVGAEMVSNLQNIYVAYTGEHVDEFDAVKEVLKSLGRLSRSIFSKINGKIGE